MRGARRWTMAMDRSRYPDDWEAIALKVKEAANWICEECGKPCRRPGQDWADFVGELLNREGPSGWYAQTGEAIANKETGEHRWAEKPQRFTLTVAHMDHLPENCDRGNLKALCAPCHCRYDLKAMPRKRQMKAERLGQMDLLTYVNPEPANAADLAKPVDSGWEVGDRVRVRLEHPYIGGVETAIADLEHWGFEVAVVEVLGQPYRVETGWLEQHRTNTAILAKNLATNHDRHKGSPG